jgi:phage-related protein (TIGR01555 family)
MHRANAAAGFSNEGNGMWDWLRGKRPVEVEDAPSIKRRGIFATDIAGNDNDTLTTVLADRLRNLQNVRPVPRIVGGAQDNAEAQYDDSLKMGYMTNQPAVSEAIAGYFLAQTFIGHQLAALLAQHWLINKCCWLPARDAVRQGYEIHTGDGDEIDAPEVLRLLKRCDKRYNITAQMRNWVGKGKVFGVRIAIFKVKSTDPLYYEYPFDPDAVTPGSYRGIVQVDPYWCSPLLDMQASTASDSAHFYEPTWWLINGKKYHRSHLMIYREGDLADILKPAYQFGGVPMPQMIMERVYAAERTANEAPQLAVSKRTKVLATDLEGIVVGGPEHVKQLQRSTELADNFQLLVVDKDDTVTQIDTGLADLDVTIMTQFQLVASTAKVPGTKLLGTQPKGFSATGEFDESMYHEELESIQSDLTPFLERHHQLCMLSDVTPRMRRDDPAFEPMDTSVSWAPLDSPTAKEYAEINEINSRTDLNLVNTGSIDSYDARTRLLGDKNSGYTGLEVVERPDDDGDGQPDKPTLTPAAPAPAGFDGMDVELITNQTFLDPEVVRLKQEAKDYVVQVTPPLPDPDTGKMYRVVINGHHSLEAARIDGVAPEFVEGGYGESDYYNATTGGNLAHG